MGLAKVPNERACLVLHFKPYNTSQLAMTAEKNVLEVGLRMLFLIFVFSVFKSSLQLSLLESSAESKICFSTHQTLSRAFFSAILSHKQKRYSNFTEFSVSHFRKLKLKMS